MPIHSFFDMPTAAPDTIADVDTRPIFHAALEQARKWHSTLPAARAFCPWPQDLRWQPRDAHPLPAADLMCADPGLVKKAAAPLLAALQAIAPYVEWRHSYTAEEVGQKFLDTFGWFELAGPEGHFRSDQARITVGYWGPGLYYPRHQHPPAELYTIVSGTALFDADGAPPRLLGPGDTRVHAPEQPHAMTTSDQPLLALVFWRGAGLDASPRLSA
ncbi:dimethylsulfonioproprionate lyase family protein [Roseovarius aestuariivivens]|uniref:dimethylsulfonioproprionate lyase family protein n=1 Tax=Roseovarius aestuariivivens TaxID=1888910 RepID=UPI0010813C70|nr:dimethylsulfonioproprionate lyase family protein [Roseovarius aestuariivivens]